MNEFWKNYDEILRKFFRPPRGISRNFERFWQNFKQIFVKFCSNNEKIFKELFLKIFCNTSEKIWAKFEEFSSKFY